MRSKPPCPRSGWDVARARSRAADRTEYLRRPDLGRQLDARRRHAPARATGAAGCDVCVVVGDGLSSLAAARHTVPLLAALRSHLPPDTSSAPVVIATQARVALADEMGELFGAALSVMLIGERPGLSSPDSLGIYLTHSPRRGRHDAERNCISNVRPEGLAYEVAAFKLAWLMREALRRGLTGVGLKDESDLHLPSWVIFLLKEKNEVFFYVGWGGCWGLWWGEGGGKGGGVMGKGFEEVY